MAKKKKKSTEDQMGKLVGVAVSVDPIIAKDSKRKNYKKGGKGIEALRKEAPEVVKRMGYQAGDKVKSVPTREELVKEQRKEAEEFRKQLIQEAIDANFERDIPYIEEYTFEELREKMKNREDMIADLEKKRKEKEIDRNMKEASEKHKNRTLLAEGGEMDSQMTMMMMPEETEESQEEMDMLPDNQMEDQHLDFIINESLDNEEEMYLMEQLQADERLSMIFDKIMDTATEFSGSGPVEGLGTEVSDSIPARLSDGEFVITAKATEEIGADNLERMMKDAEEASDNRQRVAMGGEIEKKVDRFGKPIDKDLTAEEIKRSMLSVNPRLR